MGHARALISLGDPKLQVKIFEEIQEHGYSVRKVEEIVKSLSEGEAVKSGTRKITPKRGKLPEEFNLLKQQLFQQRGGTGTYHGNLRYAKEVNDKKK